MVTVKAQPLSAQALHAKASPSTSSMRKAGTADQALLRQALLEVLGVGLGGLGLGAGARGAVGIRNLLLGQPGSTPSPAIDATRLPVPVPQIDEEEDPLRKAAELISKEALSIRPGGDWRQMPAMAILGTGGVAGGWKLMDAILDSRRRAELDQELSDVQKEYEDTLRTQYEQALTKRGELDEVFEKMSAATWSERIMDLLHGAAGAYATGLAATTGAGALGGYHWAKSRSKQTSLEEALRRRRAEMAKQPSPLYAYPVPVHYPPRAKAQEEEEQALA